MGTSYKLAITGPLSIGSSTLTNIRSLTMSVSVETEELDIIATGQLKAYVAGRKDITIGGTLIAAQTSQSGGTTANAEDVQAVATAFLAGSNVELTVTDTVMGSISGPFICTKMDANYAAGKIISYTVEFKPTWTGEGVTFGS